MGGEWQGQKEGWPDETGFQVRSVGGWGPRESWKASWRQPGLRPQEGAPGAGLREQVVCSLTAFLEPSLRGN